MTPELLSLLERGSYAALFIWLLYDTRRESAKRQARSDAREDKLGELVNTQGQVLNSIVAQIANLSAQIGNVAGQLGNMQQVLIQVVARQDAVEDSVNRVDVDVIQLRGLLGDERDPMRTGELRERLHGRK